MARASQATPARTVTGSPGDAATTDAVRPFRLAIYTEADQRGGAEVNLANLVARLPPQITVDLVGPDQTILEWLAGDRAGTTTHRIDIIANRKDLAGMRAHRALFASIGADVIQFQLAMMPTAQWALLMAQSLRGQRTLVVENSTMGAWSTTSRVLKKLTSRRATGHISVGRQASRIVESVGGLTPGSVGTIYHGVPEVAHRSTADPTSFEVVNIARHDPVKGVDILLDAMALLPAEITLTQFGSGSETANLAAQRDRLGLTERVTFTDLPWEDRAADRICESHVFVLSSRTEGLPVSIMEAMLAGVAVVAPDVGSVREVVADGVTGLVVTPERPAEFAEAVLSLRDDPDRRRAMGDAGRAVALERFTIEATVAAYCELFERMLST